MTGPSNAEPEPIRFSLLSLLVLATAAALLLGAGAVWKRYVTEPANLRLAGDTMNRCVAGIWHGGQRWESLSEHHPEWICTESDERFCSWRYITGHSPLLIGCLDFVDITRPWDSGAYAKFAEDAEFFRFDCRHDGKAFTRVMAITGPGTAFEAIWRDAPKGIVVPPRDAILLIDTGEEDHHWMKPGDWPVERLDPSKPNGGLPRPAFRAGRFVAFADGVTWLLSHETPVEAILKFVTVEGAAEHDREEVLRPYVLLEERRYSPDEVAWPEDTNTAPAAHATGK